MYMGVCRFLALNLKLFLLWRNEYVRCMPKYKYIVPFGLRMQPELKKQLDTHAKAAGRSLNSEIVERLERSLEAKTGIDDYTDGEIIDALVRRWGRERVFIRLGDRTIPSDDTP